MEGEKDVGERMEEETSITKQKILGYILKFT